MADALIVAAMLAASAPLDLLARPRPGDGARGAGPLRSVAGMGLHMLLMLAAFGLFLALCGDVPMAALLALGLMAALAVASNIKAGVLGEPLLFSDLALIGAVFRHPQFYVTALTTPQQAAIAAAVAALLGAAAWRFDPSPAAHLAGVGVAVAALTLLRLSLRRTRLERLAPAPDAHADLRRHGLLAMLLLHWLRWRRSGGPPPPPPLDARPGAPELAIIVQCESFADPARLFPGRPHALPGLQAARAAAWRHGRLLVSGFGAYTMRTEYGLLFGREEEALGFRRFDPYLTAVGDGALALPARLRAAGWRAVFVHPHDLRFYDRDRIMPAAGFAELVGLDRFAPPGPADGRYVPDAAVADAVEALGAAAEGRTLIHAVTIENHGPWEPAGGGGDAAAAGYLRLLDRGDAMLARLDAWTRAWARERGRPAMLVFFGDHRPSIPGVTAPADGRDTPFVMLRYGADGAPLRGRGAAEALTPAALHHAVLAALTIPAATAPAAADPEPARAAGGPPRAAGRTATA